MKALRFLLMISAIMSFISKLGAEPLKVGDAAPVLSATIDDGSKLNLGEVYQANAYTLVWFYPKALTGGCTKQGCSLRDAAADLKKHGVAVIGVSTDTVEKQKEFKETNNFPFPLIADTDKKVIQAFGQSGNLFAAREAYLINREGKVVYRDERQTDKQAEMVLAFLNKK
jgi:thioredoxin-dependent peroxiredoxin